MSSTAWVVLYVIIFGICVVRQEWRERTFKSLLHTKDQHIQGLTEYNDKLWKRIVTEQTCPHCGQPVSHLWSKE